jgi:hypothetical protein
MFSPISFLQAGASSATWGPLGVLWAEGKGKGTSYWSRSSEADHIRDLNTYYGLKKWGWVIYRCTYGDNAAWQHCIDEFKHYHAESLRDDLQADDLVSSYDWIVVEDPALDGATKDEVRRRFRQFRASLLDEIPSDLEERKKQAIIWEWPRYNFCIHVGPEALESVLREGVAYNGNTNPATTSHVNLVRADDSWDMPDFDTFDWTKHEVENQLRRELRDEAVKDDNDDYEDDDYDDGAPELEGSRLYDVGWMKLSAECLLQAYANLQKYGSWDSRYVRWPRVCEC